jgi:hypothetical protein
VSVITVLNVIRGAGRVTYVIVDPDRVATDSGSAIKPGFGIIDPGCARVKF